LVGLHLKDTLVGLHLWDTLVGLHLKKINIIPMKSFELIQVYMKCRV
jgi:uncharacterized protein YwlG (UPF0340 family)